MEQVKFELQSDESKEEVHHCFGISNERAQELTEVLQVSFEAEDSVTVVMKQGVAVCATLEEVAYVCFNLGVNYVAQQNPLIQMLMK